MRRAAWLLAVLGVAPATARAQLCTGQAAWTSGAMKVGGELQIQSGLTDILGRVGFGKQRGVFGSLGGGLQTGGGDTGFLLTGGLGVEFKRPVGGALELCPIANVVAGFGHHDVKYQDFLGGISAGYPVGSKSGNVQVVLTAAFQLGYEHISNSDLCEGFDINCTHDVFSLLDLGAGFVVNQRLSLVPGVRIPLGKAGNDVAFLLRASVAVGKR